MKNPVINRYVLTGRVKGPKRIFGSCLFEVDQYAVSLIGFRKERHFYRGKKWLPWRKVKHLADHDGIVLNHHQTY